MYKCLNPRTIGVTLDWDACLALAHVNGFEGIDLSVDPNVPAKSYRDLLDKHQLKAGGMTLPARVDEKDAVYADQIKALPAVAKVAHEAGLSRFTTWILPFSDALAWRENFRLHAGRLGEAAAILADHGCRLGLEFLGPKTLRNGHRYSFVHTMEQMLDLCAAVGPNAGLLLDAWHWHTSLGTIEELLNLTNQQIVYVHINDAPAGIPIEKQQDVVRRLPGETGVIDLPRFLEALREIGYDGPVVPEPFVAELAKLPAEEAVSVVGESVKRVWMRQPRPAVPKTMRVVTTGRGRAWITEAPVPNAEGNQVVVKLQTSPICGSNLGGFRGDGDSVNAGHEGAGEVVEVAHSESLSVGDRVALALLNSCGTCSYCLAGEGIHCRTRPTVHGNFAGYTKISDSLCTTLPEDIDYDSGSLLGCGLGPAFRAIRKLQVAAPDTVFVAGLGPVGLGAVALATFHGAQVFAIDPEPFRRDLALMLGAEQVFNPLQGDIVADLKDASGGVGLLKGIECSGNAESERMLLDLATIGGQIAIAGENQGEISISPSKDFIRKGLTLFGCWHMNVLETPMLFSFLRRAADKAAVLISHRFGFSHVQEAFEVFASGQSSKVLLKPWE